MILDEGQEGETLSYVNSVARAITSHDPHLADDLAQDVILVALVSSPREDARRRPWLRAITKNTLRYARFKDATQPRHSTNSGEDLERKRGRELDPAQSLSQADIKAKVQKLLRTLPAELQEIVRMRAIDELSSREVAARLDLPVETVRTRYRRSLATLREAADREVGEDALREWSTPAWLVWWLPKRAALASLGILSVLVVGAVVLWDRMPGAAEAGVPIEAPEELAAVGEPGSQPVELGTLPVDGREPAAAPADLHSSSDAKTAVEIAPRIDLKVRVVDADGQPIPGTEVYRLDDATNQTEGLGQTDAAGLLEVRVPLTSSWVAARGAVGVSSPAAYLDQPMVEDQGGELQLILEDHPVAWHGISFPGDVPAESRVVVTRHDRPRTTTGQSLNRGMYRSSSWLPPWRRADGAYGVRPVQGVTFIALDGAGEPWWVSREHRLTHPWEPVLEAKSPYTVEGQLVDSEGLPIPGLDVFVVGGAAYELITLKATTDESGRFRLAGCADDRVRLRTDFGKSVLARRPAEGDHVDIGEWKIRRVTLDVEAAGSPGPWTCTLFRSSIRQGLPELNPSLTDYTIQVSADSSQERCSLEIPREIVGATILVEASAGDDARAVFVRRPKEGWTDGHLSVDLTEAHPVRLQAHVSTDRFPVRGVWVEEEFTWTSPALADPVTGLLSSAALPAGRWSLKLVDRFSLTAKSDAATVQAGADHDFGVLPIDAGRARVTLPPRDSNAPSRGGVLRVTGVASGDLATIFLKAGELVPLEIMTELPAGQFRFSLDMKGEDGAVGEATVERGMISDVTLSREHLFVALGCANVFGKVVSGASLKLIDPTGYELWRAPVPDQTGQVGETMWFTIPRLPGAQLCLERSDGIVVPDLIGALEVPGTVLLPFAEWSGLEE